MSAPPATKLSDASSPIKKRAVFIRTKYRNFLQKNKSDQTANSGGCIARGGPKISRNTIAARTESEERKLCFQFASTEVRTPNVVRSVALAAEVCDATATLEVRSCANNAPGSFISVVGGAAIIRLSSGGANPPSWGKKTVFFFSAGVRTSTVENGLPIGGG